MSRIEDTVGGEEKAWAEIVGLLLKGHSFRAVRGAMFALRSSCDSSRYNIVNNALRFMRGLKCWFRTVQLRPSSKQNTSTFEKEHGFQKFIQAYIMAYLSKIKSDAPAERMRKQFACFQCGSSDHFETGCVRATLHDLDKFMIMQDYANG